MSQSTQRAPASSTPATTTPGTNGTTTDYGSNSAQATQVAASGTAAPADPVGGYDTTIDSSTTLRKVANDNYGTGFYWKDIADANPATVFDHGRVILAGTTLSLPTLTPAEPLPDEATAPAGGDANAFVPTHHNTDHGHYVTYPDAYQPATLPVVAGEHHVHQTEFTDLEAKWATDDAAAAVAAGQAAEDEIGWFWTDPDEASTAMEALASTGFSRIAAAVTTMGQSNFDEMVSVLPDADKNTWRWGKLVAALGKSTDSRSSDATTLRKWFMPMPDDEVLAAQVLMGWRFNVTISGRSGGEWNGPGLRRAWEILEMLPPAHVQNNPNLDLLVRDNASAGSGYYDPNDHSGVVGYGADLNETGSYGEVMTDTTYVVQAGDTLTSIAQAHGTIVEDLMIWNHLTSDRIQAGQQLIVGQEDSGLNSDVNLLNTVLRHEIGHAVDDTMNASDPGGWVTTAASAGEWSKYGSTNEFVDAIISGGGGLTVYDASSRTAYQQAAYKAVSEYKDLNTALGELKAAGTVPATVPDYDSGLGGGLVALETTAQWKSEENPWYDQPDRPGAGSRTFVEAYPGTFYSYVTAARRSYGVSAYQFRSPLEWFAEAYAVYYSDHPDVTGKPTGTALRSRNPAAADWFDANVDQGYSLSSRQPGATAPAPGTGGATP